MFTIMRKRPRTNRVCIELVSNLLEAEYQEEINLIRKIQMEENVKFNEARKLYKQRRNPIDMLEDKLFNNSQS
jgi:hypothetical protein